MTGKAIKAIPLPAEAVEALKAAPREVVEHLAIIACSVLADISTGAVTTPPPATAELMLLMFFQIAIEARMYKPGEPMPNEEQPEPTVSDVSQAADLLKKFSLH